MGIKINSRKVLGSVLDTYGVPKDKFAPVCVVVDKLDKIGPEEVKKQLVEDLAVPADSADKIINSLGCKSVSTRTLTCFSSWFRFIKTICAWKFKLQGCAAIAVIYEASARTPQTLSKNLRESFLKKRKKGCTQTTSK